MIDLVKRLRLQPEDIGGPSRMEILRERIEAADEIERLRARVASLEESLHYANGVADLAMKHRDDAEKRVAELERTGSAVVARWDSPNWKDGTHTKDYIDALRAALAKDATP